MDNKKVVCYTDGSVMKNPGPIGLWSYIICNKKHDILHTCCGIRVNKEELTTSVLMEFEAFRRCILYLKKRQKNKACIIFTDSEYIAKTFKGEFKPKCHKEKWAEVADLSKDLDVAVEWVKGHGSCPGNLTVDKTMRKAWGHFKDICAPTE